MCDPVIGLPLMAFAAAHAGAIALGTAAVSAGSAALSFSGQAQQAEQARHAANQNAALDYNAAGDRKVQIDAQKSENTVDALIARAEAQGRISAAASSHGLADPTVIAQGNAAGFGTGRDLAIRNLNSTNQGVDLQNALAGSTLNRDSKIAANQGPSSLELVLGLAQAGLKGANTYAGLTGGFGGGSPKASGFDAPIPADLAGLY